MLFEGEGDIVRDARRDGGRFRVLEEHPHRAAHPARPLAMRRATRDRHRAAESPAGEMRHEPIEGADAAWISPRRTRQRAALFLHHTYPTRLPQGLGSGRARIGIGDVIESGEGRPTPRPSRHGRGARIQDSDARR